MHGEILAWGDDWILMILFGFQLMSQAVKFRKMQTILGTEDDIAWLHLSPNLILKFLSVLSACGISFYYHLIVVKFSSFMKFCSN